VFSFFYRIRFDLQGLLRVTECYAIWWEIVRTENKTKYPEIRERHGRFFEPVQHLLASEFFVICYQLFDHRADSKHIQGLINGVAQSNPALGSAMQAKMAATNAMLAKVKTIRSKVFAHREKAISPSNVFENAKLRVGEMREVVEFAQNIISELAEGLGMAKKSDVMDDFAAHRTFSCDQTLAVLDILHEHQP
jgi:hypothetical protein